LLLILLKNFFKKYSPKHLSHAYGGCTLSFEYKVVNLDRPFVYAIMHNESGLPVFTGVIRKMN
jgi:serpin B